MGPWSENLTLKYRSTGMEQKAHVGMDHYFWREERGGLPKTKSFTAKLSKVNCEEQK